MITDLQIQHELLKTALEATDNYLFIEKRAKEAGFATNRMVHDFSYEFSRAHDALQSLGVLDQHEKYMQTHVEEILRLNGHKDKTIEDIPYAHAPRSDVGEVEESVTLPSPSAKTLNKLRGYDKYKQSNAEQEKEIVEKEEVWDKPPPQGKSEKLSPAQKAKAKARARAAGRPYPNLVDNMWAAKNESTQFLSFTEFLGEAKKVDPEEEISEEEMEKIVDSLEWEDIEDLYDEDELVDDENEEEEGEENENEDEDEKSEEGKVLAKEETLSEKLSVQARLKKRQAFARMRGKRNVTRNMKLRRASSMDVLKKRAVIAARRAIYQRFLRGRDKASLSAAEKDRIEAQVKRMKYLQSAIATKMVPKMRSIEQKRLAGYRKTK